MREKRVGKRFLLIVLATLCVSGSSTGSWSRPVPVQAHERDVADVSIFYDALAPYGTWITVEEHGRVWVPHGMHADWRPYTDGRWIYTDAGWTWVSDYEWGWAPFHYGRWAQHAYYGWYWVPDTVWGPAWVTWRHSPGWAGWAPLPPRVGFHIGIGLGAAHIGVDIAPHWFSFVEERHILAPRVRSHFAPPSRNVQLVHVTKNVTNVTVINNRVIDRSIDIKNIEKVTKRPVTVHRIVEVDSPEKARGPRVRDNEREVVLVRPAVARGSRDDRDDERREREHARERRDDNGKSREEQSEPRQLHERQPQERAALEERQRHERQPRVENPSAEELRKRQETERQESGTKARRQRQEAQQQQAHEPRKPGHSGTADERQRGDKPAVQQPPSPARQQAPSARTTEDTEPRSQRQRRQQPSEEQGTEQRRQAPTDLENSRSSHGKQSVVTEPRRNERATPSNTLSPEERRERQEAARRAGEEDNPKRRNKKGEQQQTQEERHGNRQGTSSN